MSVKTGLRVLPSGSADRGDLEPPPTSTSLPPPPDTQAVIWPSRKASAKMNSQGVRGRERKGEREGLKKEREEKVGP